MPMFHMQVVLMRTEQGSICKCENFIHFGLGNILYTININSRKLIEAYIDNIDFKDSMWNISYHATRSQILSQQNPSGS